jgi:type IV pilus assembly protein PilW
MPTLQHTSGFTLLELLIAVFLSTLLTTAVLQLISASTSAYRLQLNQSQIQESSHFARDVLVSHVGQAGFQAEPWNDLPKLSAVTSDAIENFSSNGDQIGLQRWSRQNCYGNDNTVLDGNALPAFWLMQVVFQVTATHNLAMTCRYGADLLQLTTQINNFGLVEDVESMQVLYAEDSDDDGIPDNWVHAQQWQSEQQLRAVKIALLLASKQPLTQPTTQQFTLLDETIDVAGDGKLRRISSITTSIRGRLP